MGAAHRALPARFSGILHSGFQRLPKLLYVREAAHLQLGEDQLTVDGNLEHTPGSGDEFDPPELSGELLEKLLRHTDGVGQIPSLDAVDDFHLRFAGHLHDTFHGRVSPAS